MNSTSKWAVRSVFCSLAIGVLCGQAPPTNVSVSPSGQSSSADQSQTFTFTYSDSSGASNIAWIEADFGASLQAAGSCFFIVNLGAYPSLTLMGDNLPWSQTASNSQCSILGSPTVQINGSTLTVAVPLTFSNNYKGSKNIYMLAGDIYGQQSGWQAMGTWTVNANTGSWYNGSWNYRQPITIAPASGGTLTNFPVLISAADSNLTASAQLSGQDIIFTASDGVTKLNHEIESYTSSTGLLSAWVTVPSLSATANTVIYMYYGNSSVPNQQNPWGSWDSNFAAVYHFARTNELNTSDSTVNSNFATNSNAGVTTGIAGGAATFNGSSSSLSLGDASSLQITGQITMSAWANVSAFPPANPYPTNLAYIIGKGYDGSSEGYDFRLNNYNQSSVELEAGSYQYPNGHSVLWPVTGWNASSWHHVVGTYDGTNWNVYFDGALKASNGGSGAAASTLGAYLGAQNIEGGLQRFWNGALDEVRISNIARSAAWIATEYNNQSAPGNFSSIGNQQLDSGGGTVATPTITPSGGNYTLPQTVSISTTTSGASIAYTTNGSTPSPTNGVIYTNPFTVGSSTTIQAIAFKSGMSNSSVNSAPVVIANAPPIALPATLKGVTYFPRGHAWYHLFYDWYTSSGTFATDCYITSTPYNCSQTNTVETIVQNDLLALHQQGVNFIHVYLYDQCEASYAQCSANNFVPPSGSPGFSYSNPLVSINNQWSALIDFISIAKSQNINLMFHFAAGESKGLSSNGANYANWVNAFITNLAPYFGPPNNFNNILIWGFGFGGYSGTAANDSYAQFWQAAYPSILSTLGQYPYSSGRALLAVDAGWDGFHTATQTASNCATCPYISNSSNTINDVLPGSGATPSPPLLPYQGSFPYSHVFTWQFAQQQAYNLNQFVFIPMSIQSQPDLYSVQLYNASGGDLEMNLACLGGITSGAGPTCNTTTPVQTCGGACTVIPASKLVVAEFATGSSVETSVFGNGTTAFIDDQTPTTTAAGQAQWVTDTLCVFAQNSISYYAYFGLYDSASFWENPPYSFNLYNTAGDGYWGFNSEATQFSGTGDKPAGNAFFNFNAGNNCPSSPSTTPLTPVLAMITDGPTNGFNSSPIYVVGDVATVYYTAANVTTLTLNGAPSNLSLGSLSAYPDAYNVCCSGGASYPIVDLGTFLYAPSPAAPSYTLQGASGYTLVPVTTNPLTLTLTGVNQNVFGVQPVGSSPASSPPITFTVLSAPEISGLVDFTTSQGCYGTSCVLTASQTDQIGVVGYGFDPSGGNEIKIVGPGGTTYLYQNNPITSPPPYFWDYSRTIIGATIGCFVPAGASTVYVYNPSNVNPSIGVALNITHSSSCP